MRPVPPGKEYWFRNESEAKSPWCRVATKEDSWYHSPGTGSTLLSFLDWVEISQVTQGPYPADMGSNPKGGAGKGCWGEVYYHRLGSLKGRAGGVCVCSLTLKLGPELKKKSRWATLYGQVQ